MDETLETARKTVEELESREDGGESLRISDTTVTVSFDHVMEYYLYRWYFPDDDKEIRFASVPYSSYYLQVGSEKLKDGKPHAAYKYFQKAESWNPVSLTAKLASAEALKQQNKLKPYLKKTQEAHRYCLTRAETARYYRNAGFYFVETYKPDAARACYIRANNYFHSQNADLELNLGMLKLCLGETITPCFLHHLNGCIDTSFWIIGQKTQIQREGILIGRDVETLVTAPHREQTRIGLIRKLREALTKNEHRCSRLVAFCISLARGTCSTRLGVALHVEREIYRGLFLISLRVNDHVLVVGHRVIDALGSSLRHFVATEEILDAVFNLVDINITDHDDALQIGAIPFVIIVTQRLVFERVDDRHITDRQTVGIL